MKMVYEFKESCHFGGDPQAVGEKLHSLRKSRGQLTPTEVMKEARRASSILHRYFEWDNRKAGEKFRLEQARVLITSIVTISMEGTETESIRSFVKINNSFEPIEIVMSDSVMREQALSEVYESIGYLKDKLKAFKEFADILLALDQAQRAASKHFRKNPVTA